MWMVFIRIISENTSKTKEQERDWGREMDDQKNSFNLCRMRLSQLHWSECSNVSGNLHLCALSKIVLNHETTRSRRGWKLCLEKIKETKAEEIRSLHVGLQQRGYVALLGGHESTPWRYCGIVQKDYWIFTFVITVLYWWNMGCGS